MYGNGVSKRTRDTNNMRARPSKRITRGNAQCFCPERCPVITVMSIKTSLILEYRFKQIIYRHKTSLIHGNVQSLLIASYAYSHCIPQDPVNLHTQQSIILVE